MPTALMEVKHDSSLKTDAARFHRALEGFTRVLQFRDRDCICCYDLSVTQSDALTELVNHGPLTLNDLAGRLYLDKSTASRVAATLERKGYVDRRRHPSDGRAVELRATPTGQQLHSQIEGDMLAAEIRLLAEFEPPVRAAAIRLISKLASAAACRVDTRGGSCCRIE